MRLTYDTQGLGIIEQFGEIGVTDLLPGLLPTNLDPGDVWDDNIPSTIDRCPHWTWDNDHWTHN